MEYEQHPVGQIMPAWPKADFEELCKSVARMGPLEDIVIYQGMVLDHWWLYQACLKTGKVPRFVEFHGNALDFVEAKHCRRNLTSFQKGLVASSIAQERAKNGKPRSEAAADAIVMVGISRSTMHMAERVHRNGSAAVKDAARNGHMSLKAAATESAKPKSEQRVPKKKKATPAPPEMRDAVGFPVPANLRDAFVDQTTDRIIADLRRYIGLVRQVAAWNKHIRLAEAVTGMETAIHALDHAPHAVHQPCAGQGCKDCKWAGFLSKHGSFSEDRLGT